VQSRDGGDGGGGSLNVAWNWVGIVGTGQSLSVGDHGTPIMATQQPYNNLKLSSGSAVVAPPFDPTLAQLTMVPLVEPLRPLAVSYPSAYPANLYGETPHTAMADEITSLVRQTGAPDYVTVHTVVGESGQPMTVIQKVPSGLPTTGTSGRAYAATLFEVSAIKRLAGLAGKTYGVGAIVITHGEADAGNTAYEGALLQLWSDYNQDIRAITGQTANIPMLISQQDSVPSTGVSVSAIQQWRAGVDHPGDLVCIGPKYQYSYATDVAHVHLPPGEYERLGEKNAQVYFERSVLGHDWQPLQPTTFTVNASVITVRFHVPVPPLVWDTSLPPPHSTGFPQWAMGRGFEVTANGNPVTINSVAIVGTDSVQITCSSSLAGTSVVVGYAVTADGAPMPGGTYRWGHLRDMDPFVGAVTHTAQANYCVAFQMALP
jgi:hypothetical protein